MRKRKLFFASAAISVLLVGSLVFPDAGGTSPVAGSLKARLLAATQVAQASEGDGYWLVNAKGRVFAFGGATLYGSMAGKTLKAPITGIVASPTNNGYWLIAADGGVFAFGDAKYQGPAG